MDEEVDDNFVWGEGKYTNYDIWCPMAFNVTAVTFEMTLSMNNFTNTFIPITFNSSECQSLKQSLVWFAI